MARRANLLIIAGILLIGLSLGSLLITQMIIRGTAADTDAVLKRLDQMIPNRTAGLPDTYRNTEMPVLQLEGQELVAILEIPEYSVRLPVHATWGQGSALGIPRRFTGSAYDNTIVIGGSDQKGQFDCFDKIEPDTRVTLTDMTGAEFAYRIDQIQRSDSAEADILMDDNYALTLFTRDATTMDYLILRCSQ